MTVQYELAEGIKLTAEQKKELDAAVAFPIVFDEDCPELTPEMIKTAYRPGRLRSDRVPLRVQVLPATLEKAKTLGGDYMELLGQMLDEAVRNYSVQ